MNEKGGEGRGEGVQACLAKKGPELNALEAALHAHAQQVPVVVPQELSQILGRRVPPDRHRALRHRPISVLACCSQAHRHPGWHEPRPTAEWSRLPASTLRTCVYFWLAGRLPGWLDRAKIAARL